MAHEPVIAADPTLMFENVNTGPTTVPRHGSHFMRLERSCPMSGDNFLAPPLPTRRSP